MLYWCESLTARHSGSLAGSEWRVTLQYDKLVVGWWFGRYNQLTSIPKSLGNCTQMDEFNVEGNDITQLPVSQSFSHSCTLLLIFTDYRCNLRAQYSCVNLCICVIVVMQEGLLSCLTVVQSITLARNAFSEYPSGGPAQFASVCVSLLHFW